MGIVIVAVLALLLLGMVENALHQRMLEQIPLRILVNGTRGKTTVTRMTASVLSAAGLRTYAKTTGSQARIILPDGCERAYRKRDIVSMMEQLPFVRLAVRGRAQAIVVECMAQRAENQQLMAEHLIRPHYVLMTNAFVDHVEEIGATEEETVHVLAQSIPDDACLITHDMRFRSYVQRMILPSQEVDRSRLEDCAYAVHEKNVQLVLAIAEELGISQDIAYKGMLRAKPDIGMHKRFCWKQHSIWNAFAANDPISFTGMMSECDAEGEFVLLFNHRMDRSYRLEAFARAIQNSPYKPVQIGVIGEDRRWCAKYLNRITGIPAQEVTQAEQWIQKTGRTVVLCAGNIKGEGYLLLEKMMKEAEMHV